jgi:hypothetical protein
MRERRLASKVAHSSMPLSYADLEPHAQEGKLPQFKPAKE